jgi:hypothetical protein
MRCIVRCMDTNACPRCGGRLLANRTCGCGWPKAKARNLHTQITVLSFVSLKTCGILGCGGRVRVGQLCWSHYGQLRKQVPADRSKGLGLYRGMPRKLISELANLKRVERLRGRQRQFEARELLFGKAGGRMMGLRRGQRLFVNRASHESYDRHCFQRRLRGILPMVFRAYRRRWYGAQKVNWRRFDVPRVMSESLAVDTGR